MNKIDRKYDAIIVGSGIGGLVCGSYLSKAGMKVLIVEKNYKSGGYCSSLERDNFKFNLGITSFGNYTKKSRLKLIFDELKISNRIEIKKIDPANIIKTPDFEIKFGASIDFIKSQLKALFPHNSKEIYSFFDYITNSGVLSLYLDLKNKTFLEFLNKSFSDNKLKSIFGIFLSALGLPADEVAALSAIIVFKEFILKGGNFIHGDFIDKIPLLLSETFIQNSGELLLSNQVDAINVCGDMAVGVKIGKKAIKADIIISNCDPQYTYQVLINNLFETGFLKSLYISNSAYVLYATIKKEKLQNIKEPNIWMCLNHNTLNDIPSIFKKNKNFFRSNSIFIGIQSRYNPFAYPNDREAVFVIVNTEFKDELFWQTNGPIFKKKVLELMMKGLDIKESDILSSSYITPIYLSKLTNNLKGSLRGWASISAQNTRTTFPSKSYIIENLYFTGQWVTSNYVQGGITMAALNGKELSSALIRNYKKKGVLICK